MNQEAVEANRDFFFLTDVACCGYGRVGGIWFYYSFISQETFTAFRPHKNAEGKQG